MTVRLTKRLPKRRNTEQTTESSSSSFLCRLRTSATLWRTVEIRFVIGTVCAITSKYSIQIRIVAVKDTADKDDDTVQGSASMLQGDQGADIGAVTSTDSLFAPPPAAEGSIDQSSSPNANTAPTKSKVSVHKVDAPTPKVPQPNDDKDDNTNGEPITESAVARFPCASGVSSRLTLPRMDRVKSFNWCSRQQRHEQQQR